MGYERMKEEFEMPTQVNYITGLPFGIGKIGGGNTLPTAEDKTEFAQAFSACTMPLTDPNTADCVDGRGTIALANGINDPDILSKRIVRQYAGGHYLPITKAAVAADLAILRDTKNFTEAYLVMAEVMNGLHYQDGGHEDCGASKLVLKSVASEISPEAIELALPVLIAVDQSSPQYMSMNNTTKLQRLESGYYGSWSNTWHESYLADTVPQNFSILAVDPNDLVAKGHRELAAYALGQPDHGFAKNQFIAMTGGRQAFATTVKTADATIEKIISQIGGSNEERARLRVELGIDTSQVLNELVAKGMPVFAEAA